MDPDSSMPEPDDVSGTTLDGVDITDLEVIDLLRVGGSLTIVRGPAQRLRRSHWVEQFSALARVRGVEASIRDTGRLVVLLDVGWSGWSPQPGMADAHTESSSRAAHPSGHPGPRSVPDLPS